MKNMPAPYQFNIDSSNVHQEQIYFVYTQAGGVIFWCAYF